MVFKIGERILKEVEERQRRIRLRWFEKHARLIKASDNDEEVEVSPLMNELINEVAKMRKEGFKKEREVAVQKKAEKESFRLGKASDEAPVDPKILKRGPMLPVEPHITAEIYRGFSANREGRWLYLKLRTHKAPHEKFYEPITAQQLHGWRIEERAGPANKQFARHSVIGPQFYRRTGVKGETLRNKPPASGLVEIPSLS